MKYTLYYIDSDMDRICFCKSNDYDEIVEKYWLAKAHFDRKWHIIDNETETVLL